MSLPSLEEIKDRKVVQWGLAYLAGAWLTLQVVIALGGVYGWPAWLARAAPVVLAVGFVGALVLAWYHGEQGRQKVSGTELSILAVLLGLAGLGVMIVGPGEADAEAAGPLAVLAEPDVDQTTLAVLPFEAVGSDSTDYVADGLTDEILATLARVPTLRVAARTSAFAFRGSDASADSIGRALGVAHLVEGTVRRSGDRVRVAAQLIDAGTGLQEWAETYDRDLADVFALQEEIAQAVAVELRARIAPEALDRGTDDDEAHALVVRADYLTLGGADSGGPDAALEARRLYQAALDRDSAYARAWGGLAWVELHTASRADDPAAAFERVRALADRAVALDAGEGLAHRVLGTIARDIDGDLGAAAGHYERAVAADPSDAGALGSLALALGLQGDLSVAVRVAERALALDPLSGGARSSAAWVYGLAGRYDQAVEMRRFILALAPDSPARKATLANALATAGEPGEALALLAEVREEDPDSRLLAPYEVYAFAMAGRRAEAERLLATYPEGEPVNYDRAAMETALGRPDSAFAALRRAYDLDEPYLEQVPTDPWFHSLHSDPRWARLMSRVDVRGPEEGS